MWLYNWQWAPGLQPGWPAPQNWDAAGARWLAPGFWWPTGSPGPMAYGPAEPAPWPVAGAQADAGSGMSGAGADGAGAGAEGPGGGESEGGAARAPAPLTYLPAEAKPFRVERLRGISEETQRAHLDLYHGYVRNTNEARMQLLRAPAWEKADNNHSLHRQYRLGEIYNWNGAKNHEMFFSILNPSPRPISGPIRELIIRDFGSLERFRRDFTAAAKVARGWAMLIYDLDDGKLHIFAGDRHDHAVWNSVLIMGIDMFEHAYFIDHRTNRDAYIEAFFANLDWEAVNTRLRRLGVVR